MRIRLKDFRTKQNMTQQEFADFIGFSRQYYSAVELNKRAGSVKFWNTIKEKFNLEDTQMWGLTKITN